MKKMMKSGRSRRGWGWGVCVSVLCCALLAVAGCGSNGDASLTFPPPGKPQPLVTGLVRLPNGLLVSTNPFWQWAKVGLFETAYAATQNPSVVPASGVRVTLSRVDHADAADGIIGNPHGTSVGSGVGTPLSQSLDSDEEGKYTINTTDLISALGGCGLMVAVGGANQHTLTRAFVLYGAADCLDDDLKCTDVDVVSETVVRVVLDRLTKSPPVDLCEFPAGTPGLQGITDTVAQAVFTATGNDVEEINQAAYEKASASNQVKLAIDAATGIPVAN